MFYIELERKDWDFSRLQAGWQNVLSRHKKQFFDGAVPQSAFKIGLLDSSTDNVELLQKKQALLRQELLKGNSVELQNQGFAIKAIKSAVDVRLFIAFLPKLMDFKKFYVLWREWQVYYQDNNIALAVPGHQPVAECWQQRLEKLPDSLAILPKLSDAVVKAIYYQHYHAKLNAVDYRRLKVLSQQQQVSLTVLILTMIQDIMVEHANSTNFRLNLMLGNRLPLYPYLGDKAEYASSVDVLPIVARTETDFLQRAQSLAALLHEDAKYLATSTLPALQRAELADTPWLPVQVECNLQQGLREVLLPEPADIIYYAGDELRVNYEVSIWEEAGDICYRCSMPRGVAEKFYLHRLLIERMKKFANDETLWQVENAAYKNIKQAAEEEFAGNPALLHRSIDGLLKYEKALKAMAQSLREKDSSVYVKQFKDQRSALDQCAGYLWSKFDQPPYVDDLNALFTGHNAIGEMFRRDAFVRVEQQIEKQWPHVNSLKKIFKENPPPELHESPKIKAVMEFKKVTKDPNLSVTEYKQAIKKLQQEVFGGSK